MSVYRRDDFAFPPARGRRGVEFRPDGVFVEWMIGRGDAPEARTGWWQPSGLIGRADGMPGSVRLVEAAPDRLELAWGE